MKNGWTLPPGDLHPPRCCFNSDSNSLSVTSFSDGVSTEPDGVARISDTLPLPSSNGEFDAPRACRPADETSTSKIRRPRQRIAKPKPPARASDGSECSTATTRRWTRGGCAPTAAYCGQASLREVRSASRRRRHATPYECPNPTARKSSELGIRLAVLPHRYSRGTGPDNPPERVTGRRVSLSHSNSARKAARWNPVRM